MDILHERGISTSEFAIRMEQSLQEAFDLLEGRTAITIKLARKLHAVVGAPAEFWMNRDYQYRAEVSRLHNTDTEWLSELPLGDMIKFGWLKPAPLPSEEMAACLKFFGVSTVGAWRAAYSDIQSSNLFRTSATFESRIASVAAWLRESELRAEEMRCEIWDAQLFREQLTEVRPLTRIKDPNTFLPLLQEKCRQSGVAVVVVRAPNGCRASGAARFISQGKAMIALSFRHLTDDHLWFTFFHEAAHLLLHSDKGTFVDGLEEHEGLKADEESEANAFAADVLVPHELKAAMSALPPHAKEVLSFAKRCGVSPGIVVGQLQHIGRLRRNQLNNLKRRYVWDDSV